MLNVMSFNFVKKSRNKVQLTSSDFYLPDLRMTNILAISDTKITFEPKIAHCAVLSRKSGW